MAFVVSGAAQRQQPGQSPHQFNRQHAVLRDEPDLGQQAADDRRGLGFGCVALQRRRQVRHLRLIAIRESGVQQHGGGVRGIPQLRRQRCLGRLQRRHLVLHARMKHAFGDGIHHLVDLTGDFRQFALVGMPVGADRSGQLVELGLIGADVLGDEAGVQQLVLET